MGIEQTIKREPLEGRKKCELRILRPSRGLTSFGNAFPRLAPWATICAPLSGAYCVTPGNPPWLLLRVAARRSLVKCDLEIFFEREGINRPEALKVIRGHKSVSAFDCQRDCGDDPSLYVIAEGAEDLMASDDEEVAGEIWF